MVQEIGAVAGWATVVGLAVLSALYFSQARDVKRLREWASRTPSPQPPTTRPAALRAVPEQTVTSRPRRSRPWYSVIGTRHFAVALVGLLVLGGAAAYCVTQLTGGNTSGNAQANSKPKRNGSAVTTGNVTVAVLNGTMVPGLAARLRDQIAAAGFRKGTIDDFSDKQLAESVVQYAPGHRAEAKAVGRTVGVGQLEPVTPNSRALAGDATVILIAGADTAVVDPAARSPMSSG